MTELFFALVPVFILGLGFLIGTLIERSHIRSLEAREAQLGGFLILDTKMVSHSEDVVASHLVTGQVVIATDPFKRLTMALRNLIGGEMVSIERVMSRARREAILRMVDHARSLGAEEIYNIRLDSSNILSHSRNSKQVCAEMFATGTAVVRQGSVGHANPV